MSIRRVAAIDCGTNSIRLLVADVADDGTATDLERRMEVVRLGHGVDRTGRLDPAAIQRTLEATARYRALCAQHEVEAVRFVATSATRDAANRDEFTSGIEQLLGVAPEVVSGDEEAQLSFTGAVTSFRDRPGPFLVVDIGGGSTELVLGRGADTGATVDSGTSVDVGCVRMTERHLHADPPTAAETAAAVADVDAALDRAAERVPLGEARALIGVAGSITTVTADALRLPVYDPHAIHGAELPIEQVLASCDALLRAPAVDRAALGFMHPGRVDVIGAGALVWSRTVQRVREETAAAGHELTHTITSEKDILDGIAVHLAADLRR